MKKLLCLIIVLGSVGGIVWAQSLTQAVNNQIGTCQSIAQQDLVLINQTQSHLQALQSDYAAQQACVNQYTTTLPEAVNADATLQAVALNQQNAIVVQGTLNAVTP